MKRGKYLDKAKAYINELKSYGITITKIAKRLGVNRRTIYKYLNRERGISKRRYKKLQRIVYYEREKRKKKKKKVWEVIVYGLFRSTSRVKGERHYLLSDFQAFIDRKYDEMDVYDAVNEVIKDNGLVGVDADITVGMSEIEKGEGKVLTIKQFKDEYDLYTKLNAKKE